MSKTNDVMRSESSLSYVSAYLRMHPAPYREGFLDMWKFLNSDTDTISNWYGIDSSLAAWADGARKAAEIWPKFDSSELPSPKQVIAKYKGKNSARQPVMIATGEPSDSGGVVFIRADDDQFLSLTDEVR